MPLCRTTFYASATSSTAAPWHLAIAYINALVLPSVIKNYYTRSHAYHGSAPIWVSVAFRTCLLLIAAFWTLNAADDGNWLPNVSETTLKTTRMYIAQFILMVAIGAGSATFAYQHPFIDITPQMPPQAPTPPNSKPTKTAPPKPQLVLSGTINIYGSHFAILPLTIILIPLLLVSKPMGQGVLALTTFSILALLELLHLLPQASPSNSNRTINTCSSATILAPVLLALLGHFTFFKTGHQATLASIQWDSAFIAVKTVRYPWSPLLVALNTFSGQILCAAAVPACVLWRRPYRFSDARLDPTAPQISDTREATVQRKLKDVRDEERRQLLSDVAKALATHFLVYGVINAATSVWAAHLRRHLMLYRVFSPRWMVGVAGMLVAEVVGVFIGLLGVRYSVGSVAIVFGW